MKKEKVMPPRRANALLRWFLRKDIAEEVEGDLLEKFYTTVERRSSFRAKLNYWYQVIHYLRPFAIRKTKPFHQNPIGMQLHNLVMSYRSFKRYKGSFFINLIGLSSGLAATFLIYLWVYDEMSVDKFHANDKQLYQVMEHKKFPDREEISDETNGILPEEIKAVAPEVELATVIAPSSWFQKFTLSIGEKNVKAIGQYVGKDYFSVFSFPLIAGDKQTAMADKNSIVISRELAIRLFGTTEGVVGKAIEYQHEREFIVSAVMEDIPNNSTEQFEFALSFEYYKDIQGWVKAWTAIGPHNFVVLKEGANVAQFEAKIADLISKNSEEKYRTLFVLPFSDNYLYNTFDHGVRQGGRIEYVRLFSIIAIFILGIACINFMNLSTARASRRLKEVGIKKVVGAKRRQLIVQFMSESVLLTFISFLIALATTALLLPEFNVLTGKQIVLTWDPQLLYVAVGIMLVTGFVSGSYPALYLSGFNPATILKGKLSNSLMEAWARKGLVVFQFTLSVVLIVAVVVVYKQIEFIQTKNLGYNKDNLIRFDSEGKVLGTQETFMAELRKIPGVVNAAGTFHNLIGRNFATSEISWSGKDEKEVIFFEGMVGSMELLPTLGMEIVEGKNYAPEQGLNQNGIIVNEAALKTMGYEINPIGRTIRLFGNERQIIGVLKDFHYESLHKKVMPMYYNLAAEGNDTWYKILVKLEAGKEKETIERIEAFYKIYNPGFQLDFYYLDQAYQKQYVSEQRVATLSRYFAGIAVLISCLGLFGLTAFTAEKRIKEIGIRKVLGATKWGIVYLLSIDFTKMVVIAIVAALPLSYFICRQWLDSFAYRTPLEIWFFVAAGFSALLVAWLTVGLQTLKASGVNPVKCLKSE